MFAVTGPFRVGRISGLLTVGARRSPVCQSRANRTSVPP